MIIILARIIFHFPFLLFGFFLNNPPKPFFILPYLSSLCFLLYSLSSSFFGYKTITGMHSIEDIEASEQQLYDEINQMRIDNQLPPLNRSLLLQAIAKEHSRNIAKTDNLTRDYVRALAQKNLDCTFHAEDVQKTNKVELNETYILDPKMEKVGIGIVINKSLYVTQDFCG
jgi:hypothetical protein